MSLTSIAIVAAMLIDYLPVQTPPPQPVTVVSPSGRGELTVELDDGTVDASSVPRGAQRVLLANINLSASCEAPVTVESIDLKHRGVGSVTDIARVYLDNGSRRLTRSRQFDRQGFATLRFLQPLSIPACDAAFLSILVDIAPDAGVASEHGIAVGDPASIRSSAKRTTIASPAATSRIVRTTPVGNGFITVHFLPVTGALRYGREETLARLQLIADGKHKHLLKSITLTNLEGARDQDLIYLTLQTRAGDILTHATAHMDGQRLKLDFDPLFPLDASQTVVLLLKGTVHISHYRKVNFTLEEPSDLSAVIVPQE